MAVEPMFERLWRYSTMSILALALVGCGSAGSGDGDGWLLDNESRETGDTAMPAPDTGTADTVSPPEDGGSDTRIVDRFDTGRSDTGGGDCNSDSACCQYWVDLKVRRDGAPVGWFSGIVDVGGRQLTIQCPSGEDTDDAFRCNYSPFDAPGDDEVVESSVRVEVGPRDRSPIERADVDLISSAGSYKGTVDVRPYSVEGTGDANAGETCRGSAGTVSVRPADIDVAPEDFRYGDVAETCLEDGRRRMTITLTSDRDQQGCSAQGAPCLTVELTGEDLPSHDKRSGAYQFGPDQDDRSAEICRDGECQSVSGLIIFEQFFAGEVAAGRWRLELPEGETMSSSFSASAGGVGLECE